MDQQIVENLKMGRIGIIPTDTIYGIVGTALNKNTVERIYQVKKRAPEKPFIILISKISDVEKFSIKVPHSISYYLDHLWPGPFSVILSCNNPNLEYLHRGTNSLAFRLPDKLELIRLLEQTGPLVAPSANPEGLEPAVDINQAKNYFDDQVDFYQDGGTLIGLPSTLIKVDNDQITLLRQGIGQLPDFGKLAK